MEKSLKSPLEGGVDAPSRDVGPKYTGKHSFFKELLDHNRRALTLLADLERDLLREPAIHGSTDQEPL